MVLLYAEPPALPDCAQRGECKMALCISGPNAAIAPRGSKEIMHLITETAEGSSTWYIHAPASRAGTTRALLVQYLDIMGVTLPS